MHKNNIHNAKYDFEKLIKVYVDLKPFVFKNQHHITTIDFSDPNAVKALNSGLLKTHYGIGYWQFPDSYLTPAIPGRVDYIHQINDLLQSSKINNNNRVLDIGTGANCIYPLLGNAVYQWQFVATDANKKALAVAENIIRKNNLEQQIKLRFQEHSEHIFKGIINKTDTFAVTICNPPFYKNEIEAIEATTRKLKGLKQPTDQLVRNFSGKAQELWFKGGEKAFLHTYLYESSLFKTQCFWYTTLVANKDNVKSMQKSLKKLGATQIKSIDMALGNKKSRIVAWTFLTPKEQNDWIKQ